MGLTEVFACFWVLAVFVFVIAFLVDWFRLRPHIVKYLKFGLLIGAGAITLDLLFVLFSPELWTLTFLGRLVIIEPIVLLRIIGFTMLGMYYAAVLGYPSLPLLLRLFPLPPEPVIVVSPAPAEIDLNHETEPPAEAEPAYFIDGQTLEKVEISPVASPEPSPAVEPTPLVAPSPPKVQDVLLTSSGADYLLKVTGLSTLGIVYTIGLFWFTTPRMSALVQNMVNNEATSNQFTLATAFVVVEVAIVEEVMFRLGIQNFIARYLKLSDNYYWIAILLATLLWTWGHIGTLSPEWVKMAQIFPMGLLLGWLYKRYGLESTIIVHGVFNLVLGFLSPYLISS